MIYVVIATRNGVDTLPRTFDRFLDLIPPAGGVAYVVVDNASTDATSKILQLYAEKLPLTCFHEPSAGKNNGLNHVLDALRPKLAAAELVVFADDDIVPDPDWLVCLQEASVAQPSADLFGGTIFPVWPDSRPDWIMEFADEFGLLFAVTEGPEGACGAASIWGPNMAVRGSVLANDVRFDPNFGPDGTVHYPMGSETEFLERLEGLGHKAYRVARARVGHIIRDKQLTEAAVFQRAWRGGFGYALQNRGRARWLRVGDRAMRLELGLARARLLHALTDSDAQRRRMKFKIAWHQGAREGLRRSGAETLPTPKTIGVGTAAITALGSKN